MNRNILEEFRTITSMKFNSINARIAVYLKILRSSKWIFDKIFLSFYTYPFKQSIKYKYIYLCLYVFLISHHTEILFERKLFRPTTDTVAYRSHFAITY